MGPVIMRCTTLLETHICVFLFLSLPRVLISREDAVVQFPGNCDVHPAKFTYTQVKCVNAKYIYSVLAYNSLINAPLIE